MAVVINEWQLGSRLGQALQHRARADFSLYLAMLSPAVDESAQFATPSSELETETVTDWRMKFGLAAKRSLAMGQEDIAALYKQSCALQQSDTAQLRLQRSLFATALNQFDDAKRLPDFVWNNLGHQVKARLNGEHIQRAKADPTLLYDVLQQMLPA